jgi:branched-chain amino acid transport system substrate-binding protein
MQTKRRRVLRIAALLAAFTIVLTACGSDNKESSSDTTGKQTSTTKAATSGGNRGNVDGVLNIGYLLPQTGDLSFLGPPMIKGVEMALRDINAAGGVNGKEVKVTPADDGTNEDVAKAAVDKLLGSDKVDAIVGAAGSSVTLAVIDKITGASAVECSPSNTGSVLTDYPDKGYYFRTAPPDNLQAQALGNLIVNDNHSKLGIIAINNDYGKGFADDLKKEYEAAGGSVVETALYDPKGTDFSADAKKVAAAKPDSVAVIAYPETGGQVFTAMIANAIGPKDVQVYITDGLQSEKLYQKIDPNNPAVTQGIRGTAPSSAPKNGTPSFPEAFKTFAPGVDTIYSAHAYDCATVIALAAQAAKTDDPKKFVEQMNDVTKGGEKCTSFADCKKLLEAGKDIDYDGAAGPLDFTDKGEPSAGTYDIYTYGADGKYTTESQVNVKS